MVEAEKDPNYIAYQSLLKQDDWYNRHKGQYVIFVDGKLVDQDHDKKTLLNEICRIVVDDGGFTMAWAGLVNGQNHLIEPTAVSGHVEGFLDTIAIDIPTPFLD